MSHLKKKRKKYESIRDVFKNCGEWYNSDKIIKCLKWIHGVDKIFICSEHTYYMNISWKGKELIKFESKRYEPLKQEDIISQLEQYYLLHKLEQLVD